MFTTTITKKGLAFILTLIIVSIGIYWYTPQLQTTTTENIISLSPPAILVYQEIENDPPVFETAGYYTMRRSSSYKAPLPFELEQACGFGSYPWCWDDQRERNIFLKDDPEFSITTSLCDAYGYADFDRDGHCQYDGSDYTPLGAGPITCGDLYLEEDVMIAGKMYYAGNRYPYSVLLSPDCNDEDPRIRTHRKTPYECEDAGGNQGIWACTYGAWECDTAYRQYQGRTISLEDEMKKVNNNTYNPNSRGGSVPSGIDCSQGPSCDFDGVCDLCEKERGGCSDCVIAGNNVCGDSVCDAGEQEACKTNKQYDKFGNLVSYDINMNLPGCCANDCASCSNNAVNAGCSLATPMAQARPGDIVAGCHDCPLSAQGVCQTSNTDSVVTSCEYSAVNYGIEVCNNGGIDDDMDGFTDCADPDCMGDRFCANGGGSINTTVSPTAVGNSGKAPETCTNGVCQPGEQKVPQWNNTPNTPSYTCVPGWTCKWVNGSPVCGMSNCVNNRDPTINYNTTSSPNTPPPPSTSTPPPPPSNTVGTRGDRFNRESRCSDNTDNDKDGGIDCYDPDCCATRWCKQPQNMTAYQAACQ